jgi:SAM-dependent methyltransferase
METYMDDWTDGYVSDIEYTAGFYRELAPVFLNTCALIHGYIPPDLTRFTYLELGCGRGMSSLILAAANPEGTFYAVDFNPAHIHEARRLVTRAGLTNIHFIEAGFEDVANGAVDIPECSYIVFHGIYSWVNSENRRFLQKIVRRYLSSGGMVYNSYNCMPGWAPASPIQRMIRDWAGQYQGKSTDRLNKAMTAIKVFVDSNPRFLQNNPGVKTRLDKIMDQDRHYLVHEYLNENWEMFWAKDVLADMQQHAKLDFIGQANPVEAYPRFVLPEPVWKQVNEMSDTGFKEELKDIWLNRQFRKDLYCRGGLKLAGRQQIDLLLDTPVVCLLENMDNLDFNFHLPIGKVNPNVELYKRFLGLVDKTPMTLNEIRRQLGIQPVQAVQLAMVLISVGWVHPVLENHDPEPGIRLNKVLAEQSRFNSHYHYLCAPLIGSAKRASVTDFMILDAGVEAANDDRSEQTAQQMWQVLSEKKLKLKKGDTTLETPKENQGHIRETILPQWRKNTLPVWQVLKMV